MYFLLEIVLTRRRVISDYSSWMLICIDSRSSSRFLAGRSISRLRTLCKRSSKTSMSYFIFFILSYFVRGSLLNDPT